MGFLMTVLLIWGSMHLYVWLRVTLYAGLPARWSVPLAGAMLILMAAPIGGIMLGRAGNEWPGRAVALVGMTWAGLLFLFFSVSLAHDAYNALTALVGLAVPPVRSLCLLGPGPVLASAVLVAAAGLYSVFEANRVAAEHVRIETAKLPPDLDRLRIVQITDVHLGLSVGERSLRRIARLAREAAPDLLVSTGDLTDAELTSPVEWARMLAEVPAPLGKYAVTGNHEYYGDLAAALAFTRAAGFTLLSNEAVQVRPGLSVVGFDDETALRMGQKEPWDEAAVLGQVNQSDFVLVLKHRPPTRPESAPLMDLQLSGHTHRGQIFPFTLIIAAHYEYAHGLVEVAPGRHLYTSRGTGVWGPPMRFLNPPEVTVIDVVRREG